MALDEINKNITGYFRHELLLKLRVCSTTLCKYINLYEKELVELGYQKKQRRYSIQQASFLHEKFWGNPL